VREDPDDEAHDPDVVEALNDANSTEVQLKA